MRAALVCVFCLALAAPLESALSPGSLDPATANCPVTPEQAVASVRQFCGDPELEVEVTGLYDDGPASFHGLHYDLSVPNGPWAGLFTVNALNGMVSGALSDDDVPPADPPVLTLAAARAIAEQFLLAHYPAFAQRTWTPCPERYNYWGTGTYTFAWNQVLSQVGTLAPYQVRVSVNGTSGKVTEYAIPPDRVTGPVDPLVPLVQATIVAAAFAPFDLQVVPFSEFRLCLYEDSVGVQTLTWELDQVPMPEEPCLRYFSMVNAVTGEYLGCLAPMGLGPRTRKANRPKPAPPKGRVALVLPTGTRIHDAVVQHGRSWIRAEALCNAGATVDVKEDALRVRVGDRTLEAGQLGAERRDYGWWLQPPRATGALVWWVPVRRVADALGWRVEWRAGTRQVVLSTDASQSATPVK